MKLLALDGNHRMTLAQQLGKESVTCRLLLPISPAGEEMTLQQLNILQSGKNIMDNMGGNISMYLSEQRGLTYQACLRHGFLLLCSCQNLWLPILLLNKLLLLARVLQKELFTPLQVLNSTEES